MNKAKVLQTMRKHAPTVLTWVGGVGVVATAVMTAKATVKATEILKVAEGEKGEPLTEVEILKTVAPVYVPAALMGVATITCIFGANHFNKKSQAALISAYGVLDSSYRQYKDKVKEIHGDDGELQIRSEIAKDIYDAETIKEEAVDGDGKELFYDEYSGRYFRASINTIRRAEYELNRMLTVDGGASLNDFYELIGAEDLTPVDYGEYVGWNSGQMYDVYWESWIHFYHHAAVPDEGMVCTIISYTDPMAGFEDDWF